MDEIQQGIIDEFAGIDDDMDRYTLLVSFGSRLKPMDQSLKTEASGIGGCQSKTWLTARMNDGRLYFQGDSEAKISRGILALLLMVVNGRKPQEIRRTPMYVLEKLGIVRSLSPSRANGVAGMVARIGELAQQHDE